MARPEGRWRLGAAGVLCLFAAAAASLPARAGSWFGGKKGKGSAGIQYFGEGGTTHPPTEFQEGYPFHAPGALPEAEEETRRPHRDADSGPGPEARKRAPEPSGDAGESRAPRRAFKRWDWLSPKLEDRPRAQAADVSSNLAPYALPGRIWPGPKRAGDSAVAAGPEAETFEPQADMRDAPTPLAGGPGAADPGRYALWTHLSAPLLLPPAKAEQLPADTAAHVGRLDYESHLLGEDARHGAMEPLELREEPETAAGRKMSVRVRLDLSRSPGRWEEALKTLSERSGFILEGKPELSEDGLRALVRGWVEPSRMGEMWAPSARVERISVEGGASASAPSASWTRLLLGLRIPVQAAPRAALSEALASLRSASFELERVVGYQRMPGSGQMALLVLGKVPVRDVGRVLADPHVAKVAPAPEREEGARPAPSGQVFRAATRHPFLLIGTLLLSFAAAWVFSRSSRSP